MVAVVLPDISFGVPGFEFSMTNLKISDMGIPVITFELVPDGMNGNLYNFSLTIDFVFSIQQQTYPYISDSGAGQIVLDMDMLLQLSVHDAVDCPYHF